jgi:hypothetical protein
MAVEVEPPGLARLVDFAERPRLEDWSLRSSLVRYAQPEPARVARLLDVVRRADAAMASNRKLFEKQGAAVWAAIVDGAPTDVVDANVIALLNAVRRLDELGDVIATWAVDARQPRPDAALDEATPVIGAALDAAGVPMDQGPPGPPRGARRGRGV